MRIINVFACLFLLIVFTMCNSSQPSKPPERHSAIPKEAVWYGGADGGTWIIVNEGDSINTFKIKVYNEYDGSLWADGLFTISENCSDVVLSVEDVRRLIDSFTNGSINLSEVRKGKYCGLVPVKKRK